MRYKTWAIPSLLHTSIIELEVVSRLYLDQHVVSKSKYRYGELIGLE